MLQPKPIIAPAQLESIIEAAVAHKPIQITCVSGEVIDGLVLSAHLSTAGNTSEVSLNVSSHGVSTLTTLRIQNEEQSQQKILRTPMLKAERF